MNSKLVLVTGPTFYCSCLKCGKRLKAGNNQLGHDNVYADLSGEPFKAYYCEEHARERSLILDAAEVREVFTGIEGQDRDSYSDTQDRENYHEDEDNNG